MSDQNTNPVDTQEPDTPSWLDRFSTRKGIGLLALVAVLLMVVTVAGLWYFLSQYPRGGGTSVQVEPPASIEELIDLYPELAPILQNSELDSVYKDFFVVMQEGGNEAALDLARKRGMVNENDELRMTLELDIDDSSELAAQLEARGIKVTAASGNVMDIAIPLSVIEAAIQAGDPGSLFQGLSGMEHIIRIRLPRVGLQDVGTTGLESLEDIGAAHWQDQGYSGEGIRIGVLDMGFNDYKSVLGTDLPETVIAQSFIYGSAIDDTETNHGTACAEVIHDIAPGAELVFAAYQTDAEQRQAVDWLLTQDVDIISHSAGSIYGPMDGTGFEARMVNDVVNMGIYWVNSAGNSGSTHYRGVYTDDTGNGFHEFTADDEMMGFIPDGVVVMVLNWDDWGYGEQDFDLYVLDADQNEIAVSQNIQDSPDDDSAELIRYKYADSGPYYVAIHGRNVTRPVTMDFYIYNSQLEYITPDYSITTPADAENAVAVGATYWEDDSLEIYSSRGPTYDGRLKPDISAPAGVSVTTRDKPFFGTSASAPHVSGAAALIMEAFPEFQPNDITTFLQSRAVDLGASGPDYEFGYGRLWLGDAPALTEAEPQVTSTSPPPQPTETPETGLPIDPTDTPTPQYNPIDTPEPSTGSIGSSELLLICACVGLPGLLGLGAIGLLVGVLLYRRSRKSTAQRPAARQPAYQAPPAASPVVKPPPPARQAQAVCPRCQTPHQPQARFCNHCGFDLQSDSPPQPEAGVCEQCGAKLRPSAKFCSNCGHRR